MIIVGTNTKQKKLLKAAALQKKKNKKKKKATGNREQDNSILRVIGSWKPADWKQTDPPTKPVS